MKQITNKEYEEWQKYKAEKAKGHILLPDTVRFICEANGYDAGGFHLVHAALQRQRVYRPGESDLPFCGLRLRRTA